MAGTVSKLSETVYFMISRDDKDQLCAEYAQLKLRIRDLHDKIVQLRMLHAEESSYASISMLESQHDVMIKYLSIVEARAEYEGVDLPEVVV